VPGASGDRSSDPIESAVPRRLLNERVIVEAALNLAGRVGLPNVTMRSLAVELDVSPMALYHWVDNKAELIDLIQAEHLRGIEIPPSESGPWHERLRTYYLLHGARAVDSPGVMAPHPERLESERATRLVDDQIELLVQAGFAPTRALLAVDTLNSFMFGRAAIMDATRSGWRPSVHSRLGADHQTPRAIQYFQSGINLIIEGLRHELDSGPTRPPSDPSTTAACETREI
jgi:AcrR family transcriptional regulator